MEIEINSVNLKKNNDDPTITEQENFKISEIEYQKSENDSMNRDIIDYETTLISSEPIIKDISVWTLLFSMSSKLDILIFILASISSLLLGLSMPAFEILNGLAITKLSDFNSRDKIVENTSVFSVYFIYTGIICFFLSLNMVFLWEYYGTIISSNIKKEYFKLIMMQEQAWFDVNNQYEFASKVQSQTTIIANGVKLYIN
jgi:ABC-type multidrug transport system fused ATPase/permease subunit